MGEDLKDQQGHDSYHADPLLSDLGPQRPQRRALHDPGQVAAQLPACLVLQLYNHHHHLAVLPVEHSAEGVVSKPYSTCLHEHNVERLNIHPR